MSFLPSALHPSAIAPSTLVTSPKRSRAVQLGNPGADPATPCLTLLCFDDSGSLSSSNDPIGMRYEEAKRTITWLADASRTSSQQVTIFRFDHPIVQPVGPLPLHARKGRAALISAVEPPQGITGSSALTPSMMAMNRLAEKHKSADRIAVIFSDFQLFDHNPDQPYAEIAAFPGIVHAVVMNAMPPEKLHALPNVLVTRVSATDPPGMLAAALAHSLTFSRPGATRSRVRTGPPVTG